MQEENQNKEKRHGKHIRVVCEYCEDKRTVLWFRHSKHVSKYHPKEFRAFMKNIGCKYPTLKKKIAQNEQNGEQLVNRGEQLVNLNENLVNLGELGVNHGEQKDWVNNGEHLKWVNIGEQVDLVNLGEQLVNLS